MCRNVHIEAGLLKSNYCFEAESAVNSNFYDFIQICPSHALVEENRFFKNQYPLKFTYPITISVNVINPEYHHYETFAWHSLQTWWMVRSHQLN